MKTVIALMVNAAINGATGDGEKTHRRIEPKPSTSLSLGLTSLKSLV
ncbi:Uncharacterised protein [uncultured archaeon]|nr:Uncharacterised protein [uncultured archaeon]